jgi:hypothetical protein
VPEEFKLSPDEKVHEDEDNAKEVCGNKNIPRKRSGKIKRYFFIKLRSNLIVASV